MSQELTESDIFVLLAKQRRRFTVRILQDSTTPLSSIELADRIAERESACPTADDLHAIHLTHYHNHLPRLEEADVVVYDPDEGTVRPGLHFDALVSVLETVAEAEIAWADM